MRVCNHKGLTIAVLTRNEHCPPHVHVGNDEWDARFQFSFWHNGVRLWDVVPAKNEPCATVLEQLRRVIRRRDNLRKARECWWRSRQTLCLENRRWDMSTSEVVKPGAGHFEALSILSAHFDPGTYRTRLYLAGEIAPLEIEL